MDERTKDIAIELLEEQSRQHQVDKIVEALGDILIIDLEQDPELQRTLLDSLIKVLKIHGLSEAQAVDNIRAVTRSETVLLLLKDDEEETTQYMH